MNGHRINCIIHQTWRSHLTRLFLIARRITAASRQALGCRTSPVPAAMQRCGGRKDPINDEQPGLLENEKSHEIPGITRQRERSYRYHGMPHWLNRPSDGGLRITATLLGTR
jgi:hypothetical protein